MDYLIYVLMASVLCLSFAGFKYIKIKKYPVANEKAKEISDAIRVGATAYLTRQYKSVGVFFGIVFACLLVLSYFGMVKPLVPYVFCLGGLFSAVSGFIGMKTATMANVRTVSAAQKGLDEALRIAFSAGSVISFVIIGLGLLGVYLWFSFLQWWYSSIDVLFGAAFIQEVVANFLTFGMGIACMALFARVGGGIFTKAADVGADLVGKVEVGIPEDDPRNPAVIADNVGDNVGDVAGMGADLYDSFVGAIISASALSVGAGFGMNGIIFPMILASIGALVSILGTFLIRTTENANIKSLLNSFRKGTWTSSALMVVGSYFAVKKFFPQCPGVFYSIVAGLVAGVSIGFATEYFTSDTYNPTKKLSKSSETGSGTVIIGGLSLGMLSTFAPCIIVGIAVLVSFFACGGSTTDAVGFGKGLYGVGISAVGMLSTLGITLATDAYGPIADNAGGISEMAGLGEDIRNRTDALDALGNTTAATGKGFAIGSAGLTALALISAYISEVKSRNLSLELDLSVMNPPVLVGLFVGAMLPFIFSAFTMDAVGKAAMSIVHEVRRQFTSIAGLMEGTAKPDYSSCVSICAGESIKLMIAPAAISIISPILVGLFLGVRGVAGLLAGITICGFMLSVMMSNAGGAWDNAKKHIEAGNFGGKGSQCHKAAVVGDTVGDPFKDTSGPSINILIKLTSMVAIVFVALAMLSPLV